MNERVRKVEFAGASGRLAGIVELPEGSPRAFALFAHCFSCSKDIRVAREIARSLSGEGIAVLRFDFAGLGGSGGVFSET
ncbi:MAG: osmotically inducible protein C, partial [Parvularculaceae bacterium]|nr:osmotically inducible protein C [Parvularculaceae bacterium]